MYFLYEKTTTKLNLLLYLQCENGQIICTLPYSSLIIYSIKPINNYLFIDQYLLCVDVSATT